MSEQAKATIVIERTYQAPVEELWALWTTKEGFESWWGPEGFRVEVRALEARVGGALHYDMIADTPEMIAGMQAAGQPVSHETRGRFAVLEPHRRLEIVHLIDFIPGTPAYEHTAVAEFFVQGLAVRMVITIDRYHDEFWNQQATMGWTSQLRKLEPRFAA